MTLGKKIRQTRQARGLTQAQLAGSRITRNMLSQIENDQASPSMRTLEYLADALGVSTAWLLSEQWSDESMDIRSRAKQLLRNQEYEACVQLLQELEQAADDEVLLLLSAAACNLAQNALLQEDCTKALPYAQKALEWNRRSLYQVPDLQVRAAAVIVRCCQMSGQDAEDEISGYKELYLRQQNDVQYHLLLARYHLEQEHIQAAEREIWSIQELPEMHRAEYLILRGRIAVKKEQYENATLYLQQAEQVEGLPKILLRELYKSMEICCREMADYKLAYEYAAKQLEL